MGVNNSTFSAPIINGKNAEGYAALFSSFSHIGTYITRKVGHYELTNFWKDNVGSIILGLNTFVKITYIDDQGTVSTEQHTNLGKEPKYIKRTTNSILQILIEKVKSVQEENIEQFIVISDGNFNILSFICLLIIIIIVIVFLLNRYYH